jgi:hypothetical protein
MFTVVWVKSSKRGKTTALLSDGREVNVPSDLEWGTEVPAGDLVEVDGSWYHKSMVKQKKTKDYYLKRDLTGYNPAEELASIKEFVQLQFVAVMGRRPYSRDEFGEAVSYCAEACVRRHVYEKYSPLHPGSYRGYLKTIVYNLLRDYRRKYYASDAKVCSLNKVVGKNEGGELIDFVAATGTDVCEHVEQKVLLEKLSACVTKLDSVGTGLPGFTYADLFDIMVNGESLDNYLKSFKYPRRLLDEYVSDFREHLKEELYGMWLVA